MSRFYGSTVGCRGMATRCGSSASGIRSSAQSYDGSIIVGLDYDQNNNLKVRVELDEGSTCYGDTVFSGTFKELQEAFQLLQDIKDKKVSVVRHRKLFREVK